MNITKEISNEQRQEAMRRAEVVVYEFNKIYNIGIIATVLNRLRMSHTILLYKKDGEFYMEIAKRKRDKDGHIIVGILSDDGNRSYYVNMYLTYDYIMRYASGAKNSISMYDFNYDKKFKFCSRTGHLHRAD